MCPSSAGSRRLVFRIHTSAASADGRQWLKIHSLSEHLPELCFPAFTRPIRGLCKELVGSSWLLFWQELELWIEHCLLLVWRLSLGSLGKSLWLMATAANRVMLAHWLHCHLEARNCVVRFLCCLWEVQGCKWVTSGVLHCWVHFYLSAFRKAGFRSMWQSSFFF